MKFIAHLICWIMLISLIKNHFGYGLNTLEFWSVIALTGLIEYTGVVR